MQVRQKPADNARNHAPGQSDKRATGDADYGAVGKADRQQAADAARDAEQAGPAPSDRRDDPFRVQSRSHHPGRERARVQADGGVAQPEFIAQERDYAALDVDDEGEEPAQQVSVPGQACPDQRHGRQSSGVPEAARAFSLGVAQPNRTRFRQFVVAAAATFPVQLGTDQKPGSAAKSTTAQWVSAIVACCRSMSRTIVRPNSHENIWAGSLAGGGSNDNTVAVSSGALTA